MWPRLEMKELVIGRILETSRYKGKEVILKIRSSDGVLNVRCYKDMASKLQKPKSEYLFKIPIRWYRPKEKAHLSRIAGSQIDGIVIDQISCLTTLKKMKCLIKDDEACGL